MTTYSAKTGEVQQDWFLVDAAGLTLGRLATEVAIILRGKHKPQFTPHVDTGDFVVVVNADKIHVSGRKAEQKAYFRHSGYLGGLRKRTFAQIMEEKPERIVSAAVKGMLPRNRLGRAVFKKLKVYAGPDHPHNAQDPKPLRIGRS